MDETSDAVRGVRATVRANIADVDWRSLLGARTWGFALARAWVYLMFIGAAASSVTFNGAAVPGAVFSISTLALTATMFCAAVASEWLEGLLYRGHLRTLGPALTCLGTAAVACTTLVESPAQMVLVALGGIVTGVGSGLIDLAWGEVYRNVPSRQTSLEAPLAFLIAALVYFVTDSLPSSAASCVVAMLLPLASGLILFTRLRIWAPEAMPAATPVPVPISRFALRIGVCAALVGMADGAVRVIFMAVGGTTAHEFYHVPLLVSAVVTILVIWACALGSHDFNLRGVYRIAMVIMAFFFQLLPIFVGSALENVLALAGYGTFNVLIWILLADICYRYRLSSLRVFGVGWSMITIGVFLGSALGRALVANLAPFSPQVLSAVALAATIAVLLSYMFVLTDVDLIELTTMAEERAEERERLALAAIAADGTTASNGAAAEAQTPAAGRDEAARVRTGAGIASGAPGPTVVASSSGAAPGTATRAGSGETRHAPRFINRCKQVAAECELTERETEVMILYAKGRSYARIQEELYLSRGTITTHLRHIYQKMGVHTKQEFLDYIEGRAS